LVRKEEEIILRLQKSVDQFEKRFIAGSGWQHEDDDESDFGLDQLVLKLTKL
jgi:hypothetical protein